MFVFIQEMANYVTSKPHGFISLPCGPLECRSNPHLLKQSYLEAEFENEA